jgi:hypothetical protein
MTEIALLGAGGKMGTRLAANLQGSPWNVAHVEVSEPARARLEAQFGIKCVPSDNALANADVVLMAVPDALIGKIAHSFVDRLKPATAVIMLDAAAPHAGELPKRPDLTYFITHPCHPSIFKYEATADAQRDYFGGVKAHQAIVCALMQGPDAHYALCEEIAKTIYKPVTRAHRVTVEQMAILEPALSETVGATFVSAIHEGMQEAVRRGVPPAAARDFILGHLGILLSLQFGEQQGQLSDGAKLAIEKAKTRIFKPDWLNVFDPEAVRESVLDICGIKH